MNSESEKFSVEVVWPDGKITKHTVDEMPNAGTHVELWRHGLGEGMMVRHWAFIKRIVKNQIFIVLEGTSDYCRLKIIACPYCGRMFQHADEDNWDDFDDGEPQP